MRVTSFLVAVFAVHCSVGAQPLIVEIAGGVNTQGVQYMLTDTIGDRLLLAGFFTHADHTQISPGILQCDASGFHSVGCGVEWDCVSFINEAGLANPTRSLAIWQGDLYLGGDISFSRNGYNYEGVMRWDGTEWYPLGAGIDGRIQSVKVIDGDLIVAGWYTYADTVLANGLARWDGERWHRVVDVPQFDPGSTNYVNDVAFYQGQWYIGGNMGAIGELARFNGSSWEEVGGGFSGGFASVNELTVYGDRLYVAGSFSRCPPYGVATNPGSGVVAWDGSNWDDLGGGTCGSINSEVFSTTWWNEELYVAGRFNMIGGVTGDKLAKWDGVEWCTLTPPAYFDIGTPGALAVFHDSLYIGGAFLTAGGYEVSCFGKWIGGSSTYACASTLGVPDQDLPSSSTLLVYPSPTSDLLHVLGPATFDSKCEVWILDPTGRLISRIRYVRNGPIDVSNLAIGTYQIVLKNHLTGAVANSRFIRP